MQRTVPHSGRPTLVRPGVTLLQLLPASRLTWTRPSSLPAHSRPFWVGDSASAKIVPYTSTPVLSPVIGPPDHFCLPLSLRVRSPLTFVHVLPSFCVMKRTLAPW